MALGVRETRTPAERAWADEIEQVRPLDGIASSEHKDRDLHRRDLVDQLLALIGAELHRTSIRLRRGAAVHACQIAGLRHLPDGDEWALVEIDQY